MMQREERPGDAVHLPGLDTGTSCCQLCLGILGSAQRRGRRCKEPEDGEVTAAG